jgi:hypothetical protein
MLCIDRLIHTIHESLNVAHNLSAAQNVVGGTQSTVRDLLDSLAYGDDVPRERLEIRAEYEEKMEAGDMARAEQTSRKRDERPDDTADQAQKWS